MPRPLELLPFLFLVSCLNASSYSLLPSLPVFLYTGCLIDFVTKPSLVNVASFLDTNIATRKEDSVLTPRGMNGNVT